MTLLLSHMTAADFWRKVYSAHRAPVPAEPYLPLETIDSTAEAVWSLAPSWIAPRFLEMEDGIVHITACEESARRRSVTHKVHLWSGGFPEGAFYQLNRDVYVASPAFTFLQLSRDISLAQLVAYGNELCGLYSFDHMADEGMRQREVPLLTKEQLECFVESAKGCRGQEKARKAASLVVERSASPRETLVEMLQCLPYRHGGYGLPTPLMNVEPQMSEKMLGLAERDYLIADFYWPLHGVIQEYLGEGSHTGTAALHSDRARTTALSFEGFTVLEITSQQVNNLASFETVTLGLAKMLGKRVHSSYLGALPQRVSLRKELFSWNQNSGRA